MKKNENATKDIAVVYESLWETAKNQMGLFTAYTTDTLKKTARKVKDVQKKVFKPKVKREPIIYRVFEKDYVMLDAIRDFALYLFKEHPEETVAVLPESGTSHPTFLHITGNRIYMYRTENTTEEYFLNFDYSSPFVDDAYPEMCFVANERAFILADGSIEKIEENKYLNPDITPFCWMWRDFKFAALRYHLFQKAQEQ